MGARVTYTPDSIARASYVCPEPGCWSSVLIMSTALLADLASAQHTPEPKEQ
jgi:hypothetical protein